MMQQQQGNNRINFPFIGGTGGYFGQQFDPQLTINMFTANLGENLPAALISIPGSKTIYTRPAKNNVRGLFAAGDKLIGVFDEEVVLFDSSFAPLSLGSLTTSVGPVNFCANNAQQVMLVDGVKGWVINLTTEVMDEITDAAFVAIDGPLDCDYLDGHFLFQI
jgi:hypothetical protein